VPAPRLREHPCVGGSAALKLFIGTSTDQAERQAAMEELLKRMDHLAATAARSAMDPDDEDRPDSGSAVRAGRRRYPALPIFAGICITHLADVRTSAGKG